MTTKRIGVSYCDFVEELDGFELWKRKLPSNYYVMQGDKAVAYIGSGPKSHFFVSIFVPKGGGAHYSYTTEHSNLHATFKEIIGRLV